MGVYIYIYIQTLYFVLKFWQSKNSNKIWWNKETIRPWTPCSFPKTNKKDRRPTRFAFSSPLDWDGSQQSSNKRLYDYRSRMKEWWVSGLSVLKEKGHHNQWTKIFFVGYNDHSQSVQEVNSDKQAFLFHRCFFPQSAYPSFKFILI